MRHECHMTNFGRLRNPPQKEGENSAEEMKRKPPHLLAGGFLLSSVKSSQGESVRTGRHLGEITGLSWGCLEPSFSPGKQERSQ